MNALEKRVENQVQFWSLLGPFLILLSIAVLLFKVSSHWYFPMSALIGIPLCVKWKMKGMAAALGCLLSFSVVGYLSIDLDEQFWHVGMALAMAFSFIILTLSLEEVEGLVDKLQIESQSRLENFLRLDEKMKGMEQEWISEKEETQAQVNVLTQDFAQLQEEKQTFYKLALLSKDELAQLKDQHELLLQELFYKKQAIAQLNEKLHESEMTLQNYINTDSVNTISELKQSLAELKEEKTAIALELEESGKDHEQLLEVFYKHQENEKEILKEKEEFQKTIENQNNTIQHLQQQCLSLEKDKSSLQVDFHTLQNQLEQTHTRIQQNQNLIEAKTKQIGELEKSLGEKENQIQTNLEAMISFQNQLAGEEILKKHCEDLKYQLEQVQIQHRQESDILEQHRLLQQNQLNQLMQEIDELNTQCLSYESQMDKIQKTQAQLQQAQELNQELEEDLDELRKKLLSYKKELVETNQQLIQIDLLTQDKAELTKKLEHLNNQLIDSQTELKQLQLVESQLSLQIENNQLLEKIVEQLKCEKQELQQNKFPISQPINEDNRSLERQIRKLEGLYLQLREQFYEKSVMLDRTRQELFLTQEQRLSLEKALEEERVFDLSENEKLLQVNLESLTTEYEKIISDYQQELEEMSDLVKELLN